MANEPITLITYREYQEGDETSIVSLFNSVFKKQIDLPFWHWTFKENPIKQILCLLAFDQKKPVAQSVAIPLQLSIDKKTVNSARVQNVMCDNHYRNQGIFYNTLKTLTEIAGEKKIDFIFTFPNDNSLHTFIKKLDYVHLSDIHTYSLNPDKLLNDPSSTKYSVSIGNDSHLTTSDLDLIQHCLNNYNIYCLRTNDQFNWRYSRNSGNEYSFVRIFEGKKLRGLAVCKLYSEGGSIDIVELFAEPDESIINPIFIEILNHYPKQNVRSINIWLMEHYHFYNELIKLGFQKTGMVTHLLYLPLSKNISTSYKQLNSYYLSMGDSDVY